MRFWEHPKYKEDIEKIMEMPLPWERLRGKKILITGAAGMIGSCLIDTLLGLDKRMGISCEVWAAGRTKVKLEYRFIQYQNDPRLHILVCDVNEKLSADLFPQGLDYIFHLASNTHPVAYASDPIGTVTTNIIGTNNLLELAAEIKAERFVFASSVEVYGENRGDQERFTEDYCGYIDCNTMRAGYPESKRAGEALCQAYIRQKGVDIVIPRLSRTYGPSVLKTDTKAISQFILKGTAREDIMLKSEGTQLYSYSYAADSVGGLLWAFFKGECGEAYNIADEASDITLKDLAVIIAENAGTKVVFDLPDAVEQAGYSKATKAMMDSQKLQGLGWHALFDMKAGLERTLEVLREAE